MNRLINNASSKRILLSSSGKKGLLLHRVTRHTFNDLSLEHLQRIRFNDNQNGAQSIAFPFVAATMGAIIISGTMLITGGTLFKSYITDIIKDIINEQEEEEEDEHTVMNYSATHCATPLHYFTPNNTKEVENLVSYFNKNKIAFRAMGSGISPNGISYSNNAIMDMSNCNKIINIDAENMQITVEAGIKIKDILNAIIPYNMTLENIPSIQEQQIGGLIQVGAHGTGINIGPCDMQVIKMNIITPKYGKIELTQNDDLFHYARVGLGTLGVITQVTLQCVKRHKLSQFMWIMDIDQLINKRNELLTKYKHCKWLWIPYTNNKVVVIASNECNDLMIEKLYNDININISNNNNHEKPLRELLCNKTGKNINKLNKYLSFADLRDLLLGIDDAKHILDTNWIKEINFAELQYWTNLSNKYKNIDIDIDIDIDIPQEIDFSENILSFECGGQQWVYEICFPIKKYHDFNNDGNIPIEIQFTLDLLKEIKDNDIAAPSPLEQRFTAPSTSYLSPAVSLNDNKDNNNINTNNNNEAFCWFGIIFYLPTQDEQKRRWISNEFHTYSRILDKVADKYGAVGHWAKVETHYLKKHERKQLQNRLQNRFGNKLKQFFEIRNQYDPNGILINDVVSDFFNI